MGKYKAKVKNNPKARKNKMKESKVLSDNQIELRRLIIITIITIVFIIGIYFLTVFILNKRNSVDEENTKVTINYDSLVVGTILNRPYNNYYVLVYNYDSTKASYYDSLINNYKNKENSKKIYSCDLSLELNQSYIAKDNKSNSNAKTISDFKFGEITLVEIKNGEIIKYIENIETIKDVLK